jgi:hypothetical protein
MRSVRNLTLLLLTLLAVSGCHRTYVVPETPMPPNTILLSQMMRQLSAQPGFTQGLLTVLDGQSKKAPLPMTPALVDELRKRVLGNDWQGLDRFPGWPMREINPAVAVVTKIAQHKQTTSAQAAEFLDLGPYALDKVQTVSLDQPSTLPGFSTEGAMIPLGGGVVHGDGPSALAPEHAESQRLADVLNRLAANQLDDTQPFAVWRSYEALEVERRETGITGPVPDKPNLQARNPEQVIRDLQATGHTVTVDDARYFANFAHLHYRPPGTSTQEDVMAPFWIDSQLIIPHSHGRHLLVPAVHAEYEWHIRSPKGRPGINADVSYYYGDDGKSERRTMDLQDQPWVLERNAHTYTGAQAVEVTRLAGLLTVAYMHQHADHPELPFGGYYTLGVCQDGIAAIEQKMTGTSTLFPNTADIAYFTDPRDAEANAMIAAIPKDRDGTPPDAARVFGSLPVAPDNFRAVTIPGLADDLSAAYAARDTKPKHHAVEWALAVLLGLLAVFTRWYTRRHPRRPVAQATEP